MNAADLFGGPPDRSDLASPLVATDESPKPAAYLFGGEAENGIPDSLQSKVLPVQDMPDDLFGDSGGGGNGGGRVSDSDMGGFGAPPVAPRSSSFSPSSNLQGVPDSLFGEPVVTRTTEEAFDFGPPSQPPGYALTPGGYDGGNMHAASFLPPVDSTSGRSPPPISNDALEPPPPPGGGNAINASTEETQPRGAAANLDAPPNDIFGDPSSETVQWWGASPPVKQFFSSAPSTESVPSIDQAPSRPDTSAVQSGQDRLVSPPPGDMARVSSSHFSASSSLPPSRSSSPPTENVFGAPPVIFPGASPPSASLPNTGNPFRTERPRVNALDSSPPPPAQTFDTATRIGLDGATTTTLSWATNRSVSPHWTAQHQQSVHAKLPQMGDEPHGNSMRSRVSSPAAGPLTFESSRCGSEPSSVEIVPMDEGFAGLSQGSVKTGGGGSSSGEQPFGISSGVMGDASRGNPFGSSSGSGVASQANDIFGSSSGGNDIFCREGSTDMNRTCSLPPLQSLEAPKGEGQPSPNSDFTATVAGNHQPAWSTEQDGVSGLGAPPGAPPRDVFDFEAGEDDDGSTPWWQTSMHKVDQVGTHEESSSVPYGNNTGDSVSEVAGDRGIFDAPTDNSAWSVTHASHTTAEVATQNESVEFEASSSAMFGAPVTDNVVAAEVKPMQDHSTLVSGEKQQVPPQLFHEEPDKGSSSPIASIHLESHSSLGVGQDAPTVAGQEHNLVYDEANPVLRQQEEVSKRRESHGWDNNVLAPLQPDSYGAPPGELFAGANDDPFGAPGNGGEIFEDWGMCPAVPAPVSEPETSSGVAEACETRGFSVPETLTVDSRIDNRNTFERKLDSLDVVAPKEEEIGKQAMVVHPEGQAMEEHRDEEVKHPLLGHRDGVRPEVNDTLAALTNTRSSFRLDYTSTALPLGPSPASSSPPRLFASRSASWAVRETTPESDSDFCEVFSNTEARRGGSPLTELATIHDVEHVEDDELAPTLAMSVGAAPNLTVLAIPGESGVGETAEESSLAVEPSSRIVDSRQEAESGSDIDQASLLSSSGTHAVEARGFLLDVGSAMSGHAASAPPPVDVQPHISGAAGVAMCDVKGEKNSQACGKEEERYPSSVTFSRTGTAVEHKADAGRTVNVDGDWNIGDDWSGGSDDRYSSSLRVDSPKGANKTEGGRLEARKEDSDEPERTSGVLGEEGPRSHPEDDRDESSGDYEGDNNRGLRKEEGVEARAAGQNEEEDDMDDSFEISDEENDNIVSAVERTAADFFSSANSIPETKPESPTGIPPSESSRASLGSLSSLSEYGSVNRHQREDGRSGVGEAHRGLRSFGSSSRRSLGDVQNMFPSASIYRVRRSSLGRLPPPVPSYAPSASVRSTWRSLSPSRINNFNGNEWSMRSPVLRDEQTGGTKGVRACSYSPSRQRLPGFRGTELGPGMLSLPPSRVPQRTFGPSGDSESFAKRGQTSVLPQSSEVVGAGRDQSESETLCNSGTAAISQVQIQQPCQSVDGDPERSSDVAEGVSSLSSPDSSKSPSIPLAKDDDEISSVEQPSPEPKGKLEVPTPSQVTTAPAGVDGTETSAREESSPALPPWKYHSGSSAGEGMGQTQPPLPPPPIQLASNVVKMKDESKAVPPAIEARGPPSRDASEYGAMAKHVNDVVEVNHNTSENGAIGEDRNGLTRVVAPQPPQPIFISPDLFGEHILDSRVSSQPSHLVNKDSPLTRPRKEKSLFDNESPECEDGGEGNKSVSSAADLFATEAPAAPADELFAAQPPEASGATPYGAGRSFEGNVEGGNDNHDPFSQGPPPLPLQSLPNPWGSSPLKQPLPGPKSRPTKGGTGFDRPPVQPPLPADKTSGHAIPTGFEDAEGGIPAPFVDLGSQGAGEGGFDTVPESGAKAGGNTARAAPASFMPPFVTPDSSTASAFVAKPRENNRRALPSDVVEVSRESLPVPTGNPFASFRRPAAPSAVLPAAGKPVHHRVSSGFSVKSGGSGGWGSTAAAATGGVDKSQRDPNVRPPGVLAMFGFGGKLVCTYPRQKIKLAPAPGVVPPPDDGSEFRSGPVMLWSLKDLVDPGNILRDPGAFPGPASSAPLDKLKGYVESRVNDATNDGEKLLWSIASLALQFKGCLASDAVSTDANSPEAAIVKLLKDASARRKEAGRDATLTPTPSPLPAPMSPMTLGGASWRPAPRPHTSYPPRDPLEGSLLRPGHRTVGSDGGGGVGAAGAFLGGVTPPRVAAGVGPFGTAAPMEGRSVARTEGMGSGSREEVEALLVDGKKEEAVDASISAGLWGLALLIAAQCPASPTETGNEGDGSTPPQPPYQRVVRLYANAFLQSGTPLHTLALAFSGQAEAAIKHGGKSLGGPMGVGGDGSLGQGGFKDTWMATAAAILSNKVPGWREQLIGLGDRLMDSDEVPAAHALFLVAGLQADLPTTKEARLVLPGVDHRKPEHKGLRTREATDAVHLLEVLDVAWKDGRGQCSAVQGHKLRLAMRLADAGFLQKAYQYVVNTQAEVAAISGRSGGGQEQRNPYSPQFISALKNFEDRLRAALDSDDAVKAGQIRLGKKERSAGSAAAGAGRWLLDGVANIVKKSAAPGPMHQGPRAASGAQSHVPNADALTREPGTGRAYPPKAVSKHEGSTKVPPQHHQRPQHAFPGGAAYARNSRPSSLPGSSSAPAAWRAPPQVPVRGQQPFGPRPPGVQTGGPMPSTGDEQQSYKNPQSEAASPLNAARDYSVASVEDMRPVIPSPPRSFGSSRTLSPPLPGMPGVTKISGGGEEDNDARSKGMTHVNSAPVLSAGVLGDQTPPTDKKSEAAAGPKKGAARGETEQPPKSDSSRDKKGKVANSPSAVGKKPGMWTKMMARWLHPDAKFADVGKDMEAYYDEKTKRWVFPGEDPDEAAPAAPSMPPTASQLAAPGLSAPQPTPEPVANDPLAALMAPPPSFVGPTKLTMSGAAPGGGPPKMSGAGAGAGGGPPTMGSGPPTGGLSWASKGAPPMTWGGNRGPVKSPFAVARKSTASMPKAPSSTSSTAGEGESVSGRGDG